MHAKSLTNNRYFVPDLSPMDRKELAQLRPRAVFVAESPHTHEVEPEKAPDRRPLCGAAGRVWWKMLSEILEGDQNADVSLERMLALCRKHRFVILNAVQFPLDPKIAARYPEAEPVGHLGFAKTTGPFSYKKLKEASPVRLALDRLHERLMHPALAGSRVHVLGNDAEWFVTHALTDEEGKSRIGGKIPHPSAWWRKGKFFENEARKRLKEIFAS